VGVLKLFTGSFRRGQNREVRQKRANKSEKGQKSRVNGSCIHLSKHQQHTECPLFTFFLFSHRGFQCFKSTLSSINTQQSRRCTCCFTNKTQRSRMMQESIKLLLTIPGMFHIFNILSCIYYLLLTVWRDKGVV